MRSIILLCMLFLTTPTYADDGGAPDIQSDSGVHHRLREETDHEPDMTGPPIGCSLTPVGTMSFFRPTRNTALCAGVGVTLGFLLVRRRRR